MDYQITILFIFIAGLAAGAVSIFMGIRGLQTNTVHLSAFSKTAMHGPAARRASLVCIVLGTLVILYVIYLMERTGG